MYRASGSRSKSDVSSKRLSSKRLVERWRKGEKQAQAESKRNMNGENEESY